MIFLKATGILIYVIAFSWAVYMDIRWQEIYNFIWIICIFSVGICFACEGPPNSAVFLSILIYWGVQELLMSRVYGRADSHAFCVHSFLLSAYGLQLEYYVFHMFISATLLTLFQLAKKNINKQGRLKKPVAMVPYIAAGAVFEAVFFVVGR